MIQYLVNSRSSHKKCILDNRIHWCNKVSKDGTKYYVCSFKEIKCEGKFTIAEDKITHRFPHNKCKPFSNQEIIVSQLIIKF